MIENKTTVADLLSDLETSKRLGLYSREAMKAVVETYRRASGDACLDVIVAGNDMRLIFIADEVDSCARRLHREAIEMAARLTEFAEDLTRERTGGYLRESPLESGSAIRVNTYRSELKALREKFVAVAEIVLPTDLGLAMQKAINAGTPVKA